jgi:hypothetical protein
MLDVKMKARESVGATVGASFRRKGKGMATESSGPTESSAPGTLAAARFQRLRWDKHGSWILNSKNLNPLIFSLEDR